MHGFLFLWSEISCYLNSLSKFYTLCLFLEKTGFIILLFVGKNVPAHLEQFFKSLDSPHLRKKLMHLKGNKSKKG